MAALRTATGSEQQAYAMIVVLARLRRIHGWRCMKICLEKSFELSAQHARDHRVRESQRFHGAIQRDEGKFLNPQKAEAVPAPIGALRLFPFAGFGGHFASHSGVHAWIHSHRPLSRETRWSISRT